MLKLLLFAAAVVCYQGLVAIYAILTGGHAHALIEFKQTDPGCMGVLYYLLGEMHGIVGRAYMS